MLVTFKSKAAADVIMYPEHAKRILDLLGKDIKQGVITAEEAEAAITTLEVEIARSQIASTGASDESDDEQAKVPFQVSFAVRVFPLLEMLRAAKKGKHVVAWGI